MRAVFLAIAALLGATAASAEGPPEGTGYTDLSGAFVAFYDATEGQEIDARVAAFKRDVAPLYPGFYSVRNNRTQEQIDHNIRHAIEEFPTIREKYLAAQQAFPGALASATSHFRQFFPGSTASLPTYLLHSLGEMDGGTREIGGQEVLVFGADGIAKYHSPENIGAFFDHEFIHVEQGTAFDECDAIWCSLWSEGLATAAAAQMNPGIDMHGLMLDVPKPIAPPVDADWKGALCLVSGMVDSIDSGDYSALFYGNGGTEKFPPRFGYYVGYRLAERLLENHALADLVHLPRDEAEPLVKGELADMVTEAGGC